MTSKVLMIGQFSLPVTGEYEVNRLFYDILKVNGLNVQFVDSSIISTASLVGKFSFYKLYRSISLFFRILFNSAFADIIYVTPGQSKFGVLRFFLFMFFPRFVFKKRIIYHWHGYGFYSIFLRSRFLSNFFLSPSALNVVLTEDLKNKLFLLNDRSRIHVVKNFSTLSFDCVRDVNIDKRLNVLFLGSLMKEKGIYEFCETAKVLCKDIDFTVCGGGDSSIVSYLNDLSENGIVRFHGVVGSDRKKEIFRHADIFVLQSSYETEGVPLSIIEAMSASCAVVTTRHNGIPETVGESALFVSKTDINDLVDCLMRFNNDRNYLYYYQVSAFERSRIYSYDIFAKDMMNVFDVARRMS